MSGFALPLGFSAADLGSNLLEIFHGIVLPVLILAGVGWALQRRLGLDMSTLARLNFHFTIPCVIYYSVVSAQVSPRDVGMLVLFSLALMALLAALCLLAARVQGLERDRRNALIMTAIFYNSGNYGLPVQELAFHAANRHRDAMALQVFVMIVQNFTSFTLGIWLAASGRKKMEFRKVVREMLRYPPIYALLLGLLTVQLRRMLGPEDAASAAKLLQPVWKTIEYIYRAFIAVALCTLGAQLGTVRPKLARYPVGVSVALRLLVSPLLGAFLIWLFGLHGFLAQVLLIGSAMPTSVNCLLLCLEFDNHPDYVARTVLYTTLLSPLTVALTVLFARGGFWDALAY
ncbi:MAG: AEC family transporter [Planctomycetota bacterium]|nr:AEC family transporter [Planctomycetota bacterium]